MLASGCEYRAENRSAIAANQAAIAKIGQLMSEAEKRRFNSLTEEQRWAEIREQERRNDWQLYGIRMGEGVQDAIVTHSQPIWPGPPED